MPKGILFLLLWMALVLSGCDSSCPDGCTTALYLTENKQLSDVTVKADGALELNFKDYFQLSEGQPGGTFAGYPVIEPSVDDTAIAKIAYNYQQDQHGEHFSVTTVSPGTAKVRLDISWNAGGYTAHHESSFTIHVDASDSSGPPGTVNYFPLEVGQVITFDYRFGTEGYAIFERFSGELHWEVDDEVKHSASTTYTVIESFVGQKEVYRPHEWEDAGAVEWERTLSFTREDSLHLGPYAIQPIAWLYPQNAPDTITVTQGWGNFSTGRVDLKIVRGIGLVERSFSRHQSPGGNNDWEHQVLRDIQDSE